MPTSSGSDATKNNPKRFTLKVIETDQLGNEVRKEVKVTTEQLVSLAQKGYRFEDKTRNLNTIVEREVEKRFNERVEPMVAKAVREMSPTRGEESFREDGSGSGMSAEPTILDLQKEIAELKQARSDEQKARDRISELAKQYKDSIDQALIDNPGLDRTKLENFITEGEGDITPALVPKIATLLATSKIEESHDDEARQIEEELAREHAQAPSAGPGGSAGTEAEPEKLDTSREGIHDAALKLLEKMQSEGMVEEE